MTKEELLFQAAENGDIKKVKSMLNPKLFGIIKPLDANLTTGDDWTLLMAAASNGHGDVVELLLEKGADVNAVTGDHFTALMGAAKYGYPDIAAILLDHGADITAAKVGDDEGENALMFAAWQGHADVAELLINRGADVNAETPGGYTAMMSAAKFGKPDVARLLLEHGADLNAAKTGGDDPGWNPILFAAWQGQTELVNWLLDNGADVNSKTQKKWTPLLYAARDGHKEVTEILLDRGADINAAQEEGWTSLILAAFNGCGEIVTLLSARGADMDVVASDDLNAMETAIGKDFGDIAVTLIQRGADPARPQPTGIPLLSNVVAKGMINVASALLKTGKINVNDTDKHGMTALMKAAKAGNANAVTLLLAYKADVNLKDKQGDTVLDMMVRKKGSKKIIGLLKDAGAQHGDTPPAAAKDSAKDGLPVISAAVVELQLTDSSQLGAPGAGGSLFQDAVQCLNNLDNTGAASNFKRALKAGLDPLRQGYAHANLGTLCIKKNDISGALDHFMEVLDLKNVLYESAHDAAQYMYIIYAELGRRDEAARLQGLASTTQAHLGYSLAGDVADNLRKTVRKRKSKLLRTPAAEKKAKPKTKPAVKKQAVQKDIKEGLRPLGNRLRLTQTDDESAHDAYLMLFRDRETMDRYYRCFVAYARKCPPPVVLEVMTAHAPKTLYDEHYAVIFPHPITDQREAYGPWLKEATMTSNDEVGSHNHTSSRYNALNTNVECIYQWEILLPAGFDTEAPENAEYLTEGAHPPLNADAVPFCTAG